jgi:hypothetical protein
MVPRPPYQHIDSTAQSQEVVNGVEEATKSKNSANIDWGYGKNGTE